MRADRCRGLLVAKCSSIAGAEDVATYIQSGNVVFTHASRSTAKLTEHLEKALGLVVLLRTAAEITAVVEDNPFPKADPKALHVVFLRKVVPIDLDPKPFLPEKWQIVGKHLYLFLPNGIGRSPMAGKLSRKAPGDDATVRNWRTVETLVAMARERSRS